MARTVPAKHDNCHVIAVKLIGPTANSANTVITFSGTTTDSTNGEGAAIRVDSVFRPFFAGVSNSWKYGGVSVTSFGPSGVPQGGAEISANIAGTDTNPYLPPATAYLIRKIVARPSGQRRAPRGRVFMPIVAESAVNNAGIVDPSIVTLFSTAMSGTLVSLAAAGGPGVPVTPVLEWALPTDVNYRKAPILSYQCDPVIRHLDSRAK